MVKDLPGTVPEVEAATVCVGRGAEAADQEARKRTPREGVVPGRGQRASTFVGNSFLIQRSGAMHSDKPKETQCIGILSTFYEG